MSPEECEVLADAGTRLRFIADGLLACAEVLRGTEPGKSFHTFGSHVDDVRLRLGRLPIESEGEAA